MTAQIAAALAQDYRPSKPFREILTSAFGQAIRSRDPRCAHRILLIAGAVQDDLLSRALTLQLASTAPKSIRQRTGEPGEEQRLLEMLEVLEEMRFLLVDAVGSREATLTCIAAMRDPSGGTDAFTILLTSILVHHGTPELLAAAEPLVGDSLDAFLRALWAIAEAANGRPMRVSDLAEVVQGDDLGRAELKHLVLMAFAAGHPATATTLIVNGHSNPAAPRLQTGDVMGVVPALMQSEEAASQQVAQVLNAAVSLLPQADNSAQRELLAALLFPIPSDLVGQAALDDVATYLRQGGMSALESTDSVGRGNLFALIVRRADPEVTLEWAEYASLRSDDGVLAASLHPFRLQEALDRGYLSHPSMRGRMVAIIRRELRKLPSVERNLVLTESLAVAAAWRLREVEDDVVWFRGQKGLKEWRPAIEECLLRMREGR